MFKYSVLLVRSGLRLIQINHTNSYFIEIPRNIAFHVDDLQELIEEAEDLELYAPPYGILIEDGALFDDEFGDRVVLVTEEAA